MSSISRPAWLQGLAAKAVDRLVVRAGGNLGNDAAERGVQLDLAI